LFPLRLHTLVALTPRFIYACVLSENGFCNATFQNLGGNGVKNFLRTPKKLPQKHIHTVFRVERAIKRYVPFAGVDPFCEETSYSTLVESHRKTTSAYYVQHTRGLWS